jgi:hypothetical protein
MIHNKKTGIISISHITSAGLHTGTGNSIFEREIQAEENRKSDHLFPADNAGGCTAYTLSIFP